MKKITEQNILKAEHDMLTDASVWEWDGPDNYLKIAAYKEGIHDMAEHLLALLEES